MFTLPLKHKKVRSRHYPKYLLGLGSFLMSANQPCPFCYIFLKWLWIHLIAGHSLKNEVFFWLLKHGSEREEVMPFMVVGRQSLRVSHTPLKNPLPFR